MTLIIYFNSRIILCNEIHTPKYPYISDKTLFFLDIEFRLYFESNSKVKIKTIKKQGRYCNQSTQILILNQELIDI